MIPATQFPPDEASDLEPIGSEALELANLLRTHGEREGDALVGYQQLAEMSGDAGVRYLIRILVDDEKRHHKMISEMFNQVRSQIEEVELLASTPGGVRVDQSSREAIEQLLDFEKQDERELRRLKKAVRHEPKSSLLPLLVELMHHDAEKHVEILRFISDQAS